MIQNIALSIREAFAQVEIDRQKDIVLARKYHDGEQGVQLTSRLTQFLNQSFPFRLNVCRTVVGAVSERLRVMGFDSPNTDLIEWAQKVWRLNRMPSLQEELYESSLRDGESFIIVEWDNFEMRPKWTLNERYTSTFANGNGTGCWMVYEQNDHRQRPLYAVKQWMEVIEEGVYQGRRTYYYPNRVEKWVSRAGLDWLMTEEIPWVDNQNNPLGIAAIPFNNKGLRCEAWDAFPMQDALNKTIVDLLSTSDLTAFRIFYSLGFIPTEDGLAPKEDGSNLLQIEPGTVVGTTKTRRDAEFGSIDPADIAPLMDEAHQIVLWCAMVTSTPVARFISTKLVASESTLKEQEAPLVSRVKARQESFQGAWSQVLALSAKLESIYGDKSIDTVSNITPNWTDATSRGEQEKLSILKDKKALGVPRMQLWIEMGYDTQTIEKMEQMINEEARDERSEPEPEPEPGSADGSTDNGAAAATDSGSAVTAQ